MPVTPNPIDLCTIADVKTKLGIVDSAQDGAIQNFVTSASMYWLWRTGRNDESGVLPTVSTLKQPVAFNEWYDGYGTDRLYLKQTPIVSVTAVTVNNVAINPSTNTNTPGFVIDQSYKCLVMRTGGYGSGPATFASLNGWGYSRAYTGFTFACGVQNINVLYTAGYNGVPFDINEKCVTMVALNYQRKNWLDLKGNAKPDTIGSVVYRDWEVPPDVATVIDYYRRIALV